MYSCPLQGVAGDAQSSLPHCSEIQKLLQWSGLFTVNLSKEVDYPDRGFGWSSLVSLGKCQDSTIL